jgi:flagellar basal body rod protein FlgG
MVHKAYHHGKTMVTGIHSALSALNGFATKLAVASNNLANASTDGFKKRRASMQEGQHGGIEVSIQEVRTPLALTSHIEPSNAHNEEASNVDLAEETTHMMLAREGFEANLRCLKTQDELQSTILDIIG